MQIRSLRFMLLLLILTSTVLTVSADEHEEGEGEEDDLGEGLGSAAMYVLVIGSAYVVLRRLFVWSRSLGDENEETKERILKFYRRFRKPLLIFHNITMVIATVLAGAHGWILLQDEAFPVVTGTVTFIAMVLLSISGLIMYYRLRPVWDNRSGKGIVKFIHRQWAISIILIIFLIAHSS